MSALANKVKEGEQVNVVDSLSVSGKKPDPKEFFGSLSGTVTYISDDFDEPLGNEEWDAGK